MYDRGDETLEYVKMLCEKYDSDRTEIMHVVLTDRGCKVVEVTERTASEWIVLMLGLSGSKSRSGSCSE